MPAGWKMILAPHEIDAKHLAEIKKLFETQTAFYSQLDQDNELVHLQKKILVIDNIGMLSDIFRYGEIAYIGGGFQKGGIHNTLEPAVFGLPVIFGTVYEKFVEAKILVAKGFAFPINDADEFRSILKELVNDETERHNKSGTLKKFVESQVGATKQILHSLKSSGYLK